MLILVAVLIESAAAATQDSSILFVGIVELILLIVVVMMLLMMLVQVGLSLVELLRRMACLAEIGRSLVVQIVVDCGGGRRRHRVVVHGREVTVDRGRRGRVVVTRGGGDRNRAGIGRGVRGRVVGVG